MNSYINSTWVAIAAITNHYITHCNNTTIYVIGFDHIALIALLFQVISSAYISHASVVVGPYNNIRTSMNLTTCHVTQCVIITPSTKVKSSPSSPMLLILLVQVLNSFMMAHWRENFVILCEDMMAKQVLQKTTSLLIASLQFRILLKRIGSDLQKSIVVS